MSSGYIKLHRQIQLSDDWHKEPFTRGQAWVDMLLNAAYKPTYVRIRGIKVHLTRGQLALSVREYAKRWQWSRTKVSAFLEEMCHQKDHRISIEKTNVTTVVTILNYDLYQGEEPQKEPQSVPQKSHRKATEKPIQEGKEGEEGKEIRRPPAKRGFKGWNREKLAASVKEANQDGLLTDAEASEFVDYWCEPSSTGRLKFTMQKTWDTRRRMQTALRMVYRPQRERNGKGKSNLINTWHDPDGGDDLIKQAGF